MKTNTIQVDLDFQQAVCLMQSTSLQELKLPREKEENGMHRLSKIYIKLYCWILLSARTRRSNWSPKLWALPAGGGAAPDGLSVSTRICLLYIRGCGRTAWKLEPGAAAPSPTRRSSCRPPSPSRRRSGTRRPRRTTANTGTPRGRCRCTSRTAATRRGPSAASPPSPTSPPPRWPGPPAQSPAAKRAPEAPSPLQKCPRVARWNAWTAIGKDIYAEGKQEWVSSKVADGVNGRDSSILVD